MNPKKNTTVQKSSRKKYGNHFTPDKINEYTPDLVLQQMIERYGMVCPSCSIETLKKYCPDCGWKTKIPNFCENCRLESHSQFCEHCGTVIYIEGMDSEKFLHLSEKTQGQKLNRLISLSTTPSDYQIQIFSLIELIIKTLSEIKLELRPLSTRLNKIDERLEEIDNDIDDVEREIEKSSASLFGNISKVGDNVISDLRNRMDEKSNVIDSRFSKIDEVVQSIDDIVNDVYNHVSDFKDYGVYFKFRSDT